MSGRRASGRRGVAIQAERGGAVIGLDAVLPQQQAHALNLGVEPVVLIEHPGQLVGEEGAALLPAFAAGAAENVQYRFDDSGPAGAEPAEDLGCEPVTLADQAERSRGR